MIRRTEQRVFFRWKWIRELYTLKIHKKGSSKRRAVRSPPKQRDHRSKLRRCEPRRRASKWFKCAPKERMFGDKQRVVVKEMVT